MALKWLSSLICACSTLVVEAAANIPAEVTVDGGSVANLTVAVTVSGGIGDETSTDSEVVPVSGGVAIEFSPDQEPFTSVGLNQLEFMLGSASLDFEFFCQTIFGCQILNITLTDIRVTLAAQTGASFTESGHADFNSPWRFQANYFISSDLFDSSGAIDTTSDVGFGATFNVGGGGIFIHELSLGSIFGDLPNDFGLCGNFFKRLRILVGQHSSGLYDPWEPGPPDACGSQADHAEAFMGPAAMTWIAASQFVNLTMHVVNLDGTRPALFLQWKFVARHQVTTSAIWHTQLVLREFHSRLSIHPPTAQS